jgi:homeobox protein YOX1/YHP1
MTSQCISTALQPLANSFPYYEAHEDRYPAQAAYGSSYSTRSVTPTGPSDPHNPCRLPPLTVLTTPDRWQSTPYPMQNATYMSHTGTSIRSPTATYPYQYSQTESYSYPAVQDMRDGHPATAVSHQSQVMHMQHSSLQSRTEGRLSQPRTQSALSSAPHPSVPSSVVVHEEPVIKKKRKRADANQLKVLNDVYNRTAFPSTEERADLARRLDMSARSVQIWCTLFPSSTVIVD